MKRFLVCFCIVALGTSLFAQAQPKAYLNTQSFWSDSVVVDGKVLPMGFFGRYGALEGHMTSNPEAEKYAHDALFNVRLSGIFLVAGLGGAVGYMASTNSGNFRDGVYWSIFFAGFVPALILGRYAEVAFNRAVNTYNGAPAKRSSYRVTPLLGPVRDGGSIGLALTF